MFKQSPENTIQKFWNNITKESKVAFWSAFVFCLITHFFAYTNTLFVHDSIMLYNFSNGIVNGRFLVPLLMKVTQNLQLPWVLGLMTSIVLGLTSVTICKTLDVQNKMLIVFTSALIVTYPTVTAFHCFFSSIHIYALALLFSSMSAFFLNKKGRTCLMAIPCLVISLSLYQAYISFTISLIILVVFRRIFSQEMTAEDGWKYIFKGALVVIASAILYYGLWKLILVATGNVIQSYRGQNGIEHLNFFNTLCAGPLIALFFSVGCLYIPSYTDLSPVMLACNYINLLICIVITFILFCSKKTKQSFGIAKRLLIVCCVVFLLIAMASISIVQPGQPVHSVMRFALVSPWLLLVVLLQIVIGTFTDNIIKSVILWIGVVCITAVTIANIIFANGIYLKLKVNYDSSVSFCTRLIDRIETTEGVTYDTKIVFAFESKADRIEPYEDKRTWPDYYEKYLGAREMSAVSLPYTLPIFINEELGAGLNVESDDTGYYANMDAVKSLTGFPYKDYATWIDDVLVIKIFNYQSQQK